MKKFLLLLVITMLYGVSHSYAQQKTITGRVTDALQGDPLPGVTVSVKGGNLQTQTDFQGNYSIQVNERATLVFKFIGMNTVERSVGASNTIDVSLEGGSQDLEDVVVVGYATQKRTNLTGAVSTVNTEVLDSRPITDIGRGLQGVAPGLSITSTSGDIGQDPVINLRGMTGTLTGTGGAKPLILVDNVEVPSLQLINPQDVESVSVLKDAASSSIYGSRAAWGVILITTKSGKKGTPTRITYSNNISLSTPTSTPEIASAAAGGELALLAYRRANPSHSTVNGVGTWIDDLSIEKMKEWEEKYGNQDLGPEMVLGRDFEFRDGKTFFYRSWDVNDLYMKDWTPQQKHDVSISGGSEKTSFNIGLGYLGQEGILKVNSDEFKRYNLNVGVNTTVTDWFDARAKVIYSNTDLKTPFQFAADVYDPWYYLYRWPAIFPYGTYEGKPFRNAITEVEQAKMNDKTSAYTRINLGGTLRPLEGLSIDVDYNYSGLNGHEHRTGGLLSAIDFWGGPVEAGDGSWGLPYSQYSSAAYNKAEYRSSWSHMNTGKAYATYVKDFNDHSFKLIAGTDVESYIYTYHKSERRDLIDQDLGQPNLATGDQFVDSEQSHWNTLGFFGRINYSYKDKFLLEINGRKDGSSRLSPNKKWGFFPSMSAGYILSEESFLEFSKPFLSFLKIRGSWGAIGNQNTVVSNIYSVLPTVNSNWLIDEKNILTVQNQLPISGALTWETVTTLDFGLDARFYKNKFGVAFDWYERTTSDMHTTGVTLPETFGAPAPKRNYGTLTTRGWELELDYRQQFDNGLNLNAGVMLSDFKEQLTTFEGSRLLSGNYKGQILGDIWGYETDRFFTEDDFTTNANGDLVLKEGIPSQKEFESGNFVFGPGDIKYKDLNGDGVISKGSNTADDPGDQKVIGNMSPRYQYGIKLGADFKGFDLNLFLQGVGSRSYWGQGPMFVPGWRPHEGWYEHQLDYWTPENTNAFYPRPAEIGEASVKNFLPQSRYLLDLSYLRVKNLAVGYTLPKRTIEKIKLQNVRVYFSGENLLTFDKLGDIPLDPEVNVTEAGKNDNAAFGRVYPYRKTISLGIQVTL